MNNNIDNFWSLVNEIGWGTKTTDYESVESFLMNKYSWEQCEEFRMIAHNFQNDLYKSCFSVVKSLGDDSFNDLLYHIVGLGHEEYQKVLKKPSLANERAIKYDFKESFIYCFPHKHDYEKKNLSHHTKFATDIVDSVNHVYVLGSAEIPWLSNMVVDLDLIRYTLQKFVDNPTKMNILDYEESLLNANKKVSSYLKKLTLSNEDNKVRTLTDIWPMKTFFREYRKYCTNIPL